MAETYVGEIRMFAGNFAPAGWVFCDGELLPISSYETLYLLIGTTYGGDGESTFALPDLRGRLPLHQGNGFVLSETGGMESVTLTTQQIPAHSHSLAANTAPGATLSSSPAGNLLAAPTGVDLYRSATPTAAMPSNMLGPVGGNQPHSNFQPYLCVNFIISLYGTFPSVN